MSSTLEDRLRRHYSARSAHLPSHGPGLEAADVQDVPVSTERSPTRAIWRRAIVLTTTAAAVIALAFVLVALPTEDSDPVASPANTTGDVLPAFDLDISGAVLVEDNITPASGADVALWKDLGNDTYLSLTVREGIARGDGPRGIAGTPLDSSFPSAHGSAWFLAAPGDEPETALMWWERTDGDVWILTAHWYSTGTMPADPVGELTRWALTIESASLERDEQSYVLSDPAMGLVNADEAGDRRSRTRVWQLQGEDVTFLLFEDSEAAEFSNLLDHGIPTAMTVNGQAMWTVHATSEGQEIVGWRVDADTEIWATLTIPRELAQRRDQIIAAIGAP